MRQAPLIFALLLTALCSSQCDRGQSSSVVVVETEPTVTELISSVLDEDGSIQEIPFSEVIEAACGKRVIPMDPNDETDRVIIDELSRTCRETMTYFNQDDSPVAGKRRATEVTEQFEKKINELMNRAPGFSSGYSRTRVGTKERSGYPVLRIVHEETGRVTYVSPKLVERGSLHLNLKTFFYTPKGDMGKIHDDANHVIIGIEHDGNTGQLKFLKWHLVDLARFKVEMKTEFQAANRDIYRSDLIIKNGEGKP